MANHVLTGETDFSLVLGGPLYQLYLRAKLARPPLELVWRRAIAISLICWIPPFVLALLAGQAFGTAGIPFLLSVGVHARFLVALPLLVGSELIVHDRMRAVARQFLEREMIRVEDSARFAGIFRSALRLRNSTLAEIAILLFVVGFSCWAWREIVVAGCSTWYAATTQPLHLTAAGIWYAFVSLPVLRFILLSWYFRLFVWYRFLWHVGAHLSGFELEILTAVAFLVATVLVPLGFFIIRLEKAQQLARGQYGILASHYVNDFHRKWIDGHSERAEPLLGTQDIQSLSDLGNAYGVVTEMRLLPFGKETVVQLTIIVALPFLPLLLTIAPLHDVIHWLIRLAF